MYKRQVLPYLYRVCSLDSLELASVLDREAARLNRTIGVLAEFNLAEESTKTGMDKTQAFAFFEALRQFCLLYTSCFFHIAFRNRHRVVHRPGKDRRHVILRHRADALRRLIENFLAVDAEDVYKRQIQCCQCWTGCLLLTIFQRLRYRKST